MKKMWKKALCSAMVVTMMASTVPATLQADAAAKKAKVASTSIKVGEKKTLKVKYKPKKATLKWSSTNTKVVTVSKKGVIKGKAAGTAYIKVKVKAPKKKAYTIKAKIKVKAVPTPTPTNPKGDYAKDGKDSAGNVMPRAIVTQDAEVDDQNSLVHFLLYTNEIEVQGIVQSASRYHWEGVEGAVNPKDNKQALNTTADFSQNYRWPGTDWMYSDIDAYAEVYKNLKVQDPGYPSPEYLKTITKVGNIGYEGDMRESTDGSQLMKEAILDNDERPLYLLAWGGANTVGRALKDIEAEYKDTDQWPAMREKIINKVKIFAWGTQDRTYFNYIGEEYPEIPYVDVSKTCYGYAWSSNLRDGNPDNENPSSVTKPIYERYCDTWMYKYIEKGHGALLDKYVTWGDGTYLQGEGDSDQFGLDEIVGTTNWWGGRMCPRVYQRYDFLSEGDSPSFFILFNTGLRSLESMANGSYAGRYALDTSKKNSQGVQQNYWVEQKDTDSDGVSRNSDIKFMLDVQNEFATRAAWCTASSYAAANHEPSLTVREGIDITAKAGQKVTLHLDGTDPDGDSMTYKTFVYKEASSYANAADITLKGAKSDVVSFVVPEDVASGDTINIVARVADDNYNALMHYAQVIVTIE